MTDLLPVTQEDREAVKAFHSEMARRLMSDIESGTSLFDAKGNDSDAIYQAFARHRIAALTAKDAQIAALREAVEQAIGSYVKDPADADYQRGYLGAMIEVSALLAALTQDQPS